MRDEFTAERAKQFSAFAALKGLDETLYTFTQRREEKPLLGEDAAEELNCRLCAMQPGDDIECSFYKGGRLLHLSGRLEKIYPCERRIRVSGTLVGIDSVVELKIL